MKIINMNERVVLTLSVFVTVAVAITTTVAVTTDGHHDDRCHQWLPMTTTMSKGAWSCDVFAALTIYFLFCTFVLNIYQEVAQCDDRESRPIS